MTDWKAKLKALDPCPEAYRWAIKHKTLREAWRMCLERAWMTWLLSACGDTIPIYDILELFPGWGSNWTQESLQDTYIILNFMPNPPRLPEIRK
ncbi:hypothetical protein LCGC14_2817840 [marine sediment metagenome]|uniref:Uncharacterized protein n=1 Tax=marine sediment metagenome TaxID=412755 RepID=A0A0F9B978_9ZZZZ